MTRLALRSLSTPILQIPGVDPWYAAPSDPALSVMTDFRERASVTVSETATIDSALDHMKHNGVRCAFAVDEHRRTVVGLITSYDITGEKPMRHMQDTRSRRQDVLVRDIMQGVADWQVVDIKDIEQATVRAVSQLFDESPFTHIAVMETGTHGEQRLRGLLSAAKVRRLLSRPEALGKA
jgi:CBS-domain-containing membrane protein